MVKNYLKLAFRNFKKRKGYTFINVLGLAIAMACCIFIGIYVQYELSYDTFLNRSECTFRISQKNVTTEKTTTNATTPFLLGPTLESEFPGAVEKTTRFYDAGDKNHTFLNRKDERSFIEYNFFFADSSFIDVFDIELERGNPETALLRPLSLIMTREKARRYFGDENPIGKTLSFEGVPSMKMEVTGIMKPIPENSHLQADIVASFNSLNILYSQTETWDEGWFANDVWTYALLKKGAAPDELSPQLAKFVEKYYSQDKASNETITLGLQPVERIHLYSNLDKELQPNGSISYVYLFSTIALLLLVIACINFMNLATARAAERSREVGMRKALGANRFQLFAQFMGESFLLSFIAVFVAVILVAAGIPFLSDLIDKPLVFNPLQNIPLLVVIFGLFIIVGFLAGLYPALYLSSYEPRQILHGDVARGRGGSMLRKGLVVVQFAMSVTLIIGTAIVFLQLNHMQEKELGFDQEQIVIMDISQNLIAWEYDAFKERTLQRSSAIETITGTEKILGSEEQEYWRIAPAGKGGKQGEANHALWVLHDFVETFDLDVIAGRSFSEEYSTDQGKAILINRKMAKKLGHENPRDALGELFYYTPVQGEQQTMQVIGVVDDFNYTSLKREIKPMVISLAASQRYRLGTISYAAAKVKAGRMQDALSDLEEVWSEINHIDPFTYSFQDQELEKVYAAEAKTSTMMSIFTILCIIVACLGLFGLASFTSMQRTKEIGIRKTLGASVSSIVLLLSRQYIKLVLIANVIVWPFVFFLISWWLQDFSYRVELGWNLLVIFLAVCVASLGLCLFTVGFHSVKAALTNPVESIRQE